MTEAGFNDSTSTLSLLATRRSGKARDLITPGPSADELATILSAAARVPDHGKLAPWRFVEITDRAAFAQLLVRLYQRATPGKLELKALEDFARQAPTLVAVVSLAADGMRIPEWEQILSAGAAAQNLLIAAHALGYAGNWLTDPAAYLPGIAEELGVPGGRVAGFIFLGTPGRALEERPRPDAATIRLRWPG